MFLKVELVLAGEEGAPIYIHIPMHSTRCFPKLLLDLFGLFSIPLFKVIAERHNFKAEGIQEILLGAMGINPRDETNAPIIFINLIKHNVNS
jgi:hypothetical protein